MSAILDCALQLAQQKVRLFQVRPNSKLPAVSDFSSKATSDTHKLHELFGIGNYNSGIACGKITDNFYLVGFDIDNKDGRNGYETLELMEELGESFPPTWSQKTPSGGEHRLFWSPVPIRQGTNVLGSGIDLRGDGGYLVGPGSVIDGLHYAVFLQLAIARFPDWSIKKYQKLAPVYSIGAPKNRGTPPENQILALRQSMDYLNALDIVHPGARSDQCFKVAAKLKDFGLARDQVTEVMATCWKCEPMLSDGELNFTIDNAFKYSKNVMGSAAPDFHIEEGTPEEPDKKIPSEDEFNKDHFYTAFAGVSRVYRETIDEECKLILESWPLHVFHENYAWKKMDYNGKRVKTSKMWVESVNRRSYERLYFDPSGKARKREYNLWRGFNIKPAEKDAPVDPKGVEAVELFLEHCRENVCEGNKEHSDWFLGYMAHIFQKPGTKPGVSVVLRGKKGTGKTIIAEILNHLIGSNAITVASKQHIIGHFNSIMEDKLLVTLDEAFWAGDKAGEGILKDVITGHTRVITHKGAESYVAKVYDRVLILSNEAWTVSASEDERRFAVFNISDKRRLDRDFFGRIQNGLFNHGGAELLMRFFLDYDLETMDVFTAPNTKGLTEQKEHSISAVARWWHDCLEEGQILGMGVDGWPSHIPLSLFYQSFVNLLHLQRYKSHITGKIPMLREIRKMVKSSITKCCKEGLQVHKVIVIPPLDVARAEWDSSMYKVDWMGDMDETVIADGVPSS